MGETKRKVTAILEKNRGRYISGQEIADELGVTRTAVWAYVCQLRDEGYPITSMTHKGYRLDSSEDVLSAEGIAESLPADLAEKVRIELFPTITSTNHYVKERAKAGHREGLVVCAGEQREGRGRLRREFFSPSDTGVYFSLLLRPDIPAYSGLMLTVVAAVAVCRGIKEVVGVETGIKWVNDIFLNGKKVCGILTETSYSKDTDGFEYAVVGIGVNVYDPAGGFPEEIRDIAGYITDNSSEGLRNRLCAAIIRNFYEMYEKIEEDRGYVEEYRRRSILIGKKVTLVNSRGKDKATVEVVDIDDECSLMVRGEDGSVKKVLSGEVRIFGE